MRVAIVGGTGFVGGYLAEALLGNDHKPALLVRPGSEGKIRRPSACDIVSGDLEAMADLVALLKNCEAAIYNVGILREQNSRGITFEKLQYQGVVRWVEAARVCGVTRLLLMSANGVKIDGTAYQSTKFRAEEHARSSGLAVTVFRPSVIFGNPHGTMEIATQMHRDLVAPPLPAVGFVKAFGPNRGEVVMSPVHVEDVADAFVAALIDPATIGATYTLGGPETLSWSEMLRRVAAAVGRKKWIVPMPIELMKLPAALLDWLPIFPVTRDQLTMLGEGNAASPADVTALIGREPRAFVKENLTYLAA